MKWTRVSHKVPQTPRRILLFLDGHIHTGRYDKHFDRWYVDILDSITPEEAKLITHWGEMPHGPF